MIRPLATRRASGEERTRAPSVPKHELVDRREAAAHAPVTNPRMGRIRSHANRSQPFRDGITSNRSTMRFIPTRVHAVIDYIVAVILLGLPYLFDAWAGGGAKVWVPMALGIATIIYSLLTSYELGVLPILSMPVHLVLDASSGLVLALSPYLFGF